MKFITGEKKVRMLFFFLLCCGLPLIGFSQPGNPGGDPDVPISGIEWLLLSGGILGARKIYINFRNRNPET